MRYLKTLAFFTLVLGSSSVWANCTAPDDPQLPEGGNASYDEMVAGQQAVKDFQADNAEYRSCVEEDIAAAAAVANNEEASEEEKAKAEERHSEAVETYNAAVSREEKLAEQFNTELQAFKAANAE